jgi:hypothetical protein
MKEMIEQAFQALVGLPLWDAGRTADLVWFAFGDRRIVIDERRGTKEVGTIALHIQCAWRIVGPEGIVVARRDIYYPAGEDPYHEIDDFDWGTLGASRFDEHIAAWIAARAATPSNVIGAEGDCIGGFKLSLSDGFAVEAFPVDSLDGEHWRVFRPYTEAPHFVVTGRGIEED